MSHRAIFLVWSLTAAAVVAPVQGQDRASQDSTLNAIDTLLRQGSYLSAEVEGRRLLEQPALSDSVRAQAEKYVAFSLVAEGDQNSARLHFVAALRADSALSLDPVMTSPKILAIFREAQSRYENERQAAAARASTPTGPSAEPVSWRAIVFPGWEQVHQGRATKGYTLLALGAGTALATLGADYERRSARSDYLAATTGAVAQERYTRYDSWQKAEYYSAGAFGFIFLYSMIDSFLDLPPAVDVSVTAYPTPRYSLRLGF